MCPCKKTRDRSSDILAKVRALAPAVEAHVARRRKTADSANAVRAAIANGVAYDVDLRSPAIDGIIANQRRRSEEAKRIRAMNAAHQARWADETKRQEAGR